VNHGGLKICAAWLCLLSPLLALSGPVMEIALSGPENGTRLATLKAVWEIPAETEDYLVGSIIDVGRDGDGNILCLDYTLKNLKIFTPDGQWLRTVGREGEGPGEVRDARTLFQTRETFGILQVMPAAIVWLYPDGTPAGKTTIGHAGTEGEFLLCAHGVQSVDGLFCWLNQNRFQDGRPGIHSQISVISEDGTIGQPLYNAPEMPDARTESGINEGLVYDIWLRRWTSDGQGGLWVSPERDRYILEHHDATGAHDLSITRDYQPIERNPAGREHIVSWFLKRGWTKDQIEVGKTAPVVQSLRRTPTGQIWVDLDQGGQEDGAHAKLVFDILDSSGSYLEQIQVTKVRKADFRQFLDERFALALVTNEVGEAVICLEELMDTP